MMQEFEINQKLQKTLTDMIVKKDENIDSLLDPSAVDLTQLDLNDLLMTSLKSKRHAIPKRLVDVGANALPSAMLHLQTISMSDKKKWDNNGFFDTKGYDAVRNMIFQALRSKFLIYNDTEKKALAMFIVNLLENKTEQCQTELLQLLANSSIIQQINIEWFVVKALKLEPPNFQIAQLLIEKGANNLITALRIALFFTTDIGTLGRQFIENTITAFEKRAAEVLQKEQESKYLCNLLETLIKNKRIKTFDLINIPEVKSSLASFPAECGILLWAALEAGLGSVAVLLIQTGVIQNLAERLIDAQNRKNWVVGSRYELTVEAIVNALVARANKDKLEEEEIECIKKAVFTMAERGELNNILQLLRVDSIKKEIPLDELIIHAIQKDQDEFLRGFAEEFEETKVTIFVSALNMNRETLARSMFKPWLDENNLAKILLAIHKMFVDCVPENLSANCLNYYNDIINLIKTPEFFTEEAVKNKATWHRNFMKVMKSIVLENRLKEFDMPHINKLLDLGKLLLAAIRLKKLDIARYILIKLENTQEELTTPLLSALETAVETHISLDLDSKQKDITDKSQLYELTQLRISIINLLTSKNTEINNQLKTVLHTMVQMGDFETITFLINHYKFESEFFKELLETAIIHENRTIIDFFEKTKGIQLSDKKLNLMLYEAVKTNNLKLCRHLLAKDLSKDEIGRFDLNQSIDINNQPFYLLEYAITKNSHEIAMALLNYSHNHPLTHIPMAAAAAIAAIKEKKDNYKRGVSYMYPPSQLDALENSDGYKKLKSRAENKTNGTLHMSEIDEEEYTPRGSRAITNEHN